MFEDVRHERSLLILLSITDSDILKQGEFLEHEVKVVKSLALETSHRQNYWKIM